MHNMLLCSLGLSFVALQAGSDKLHFLTFYKLPAFCVLIFCIQSGPKKCIHSLLINIFGINLNEISISG